MVQLVWFKRDLRTVDHRPLSEASRSGTVLPLYVAEPAYWRQPSSSARQWEAIAGTLSELSLRLSRLGSPLFVRTGDAVDVMAWINERYGITRVLAHEETGDGWTFERDKSVRAFCRDNGIAFVEFPKFGVVRGLKDRDQWSRRHAAYMKEPLVPEPTHFVPVAGLETMAIPSAGDLGLVADGCDYPQPGTRLEAFEQLKGFFGGRGAGYRRGMSSPLTGETSCSRLSVPLSTGSISIREVLKRAYFERIDLGRHPQAERPIPIAAVDSLIARLHWHCHFIQKLESEPALEFRSLHRLHEQARADAVNAALLDAWATGRTGFPFLDACMRSLVATGWLNFRMRAMVQAFASYHLNLDWRASGLRIARLFTDYEPGIHWPQVQMQGGQTGINTPRIYNPVKQGLDQDPDGIFTRRWVPELRDAPLGFLQQPWRMDLIAQSRARCLIGVDYPAPLVDHERAARSARERLSQIRHRPGYRDVAQAVFSRHGSRRRRIDEDDPPRTKRIPGHGGAAPRQLAMEF